MPVDRIQFVEYNTLWPSRFREEAAMIGAVLGLLTQHLEHVGSTAVPGLAAKPVIDIQVSVASLQPRGAFADLLALIGYTHIDVGEEERRNGRFGVHAMGLGWRTYFTGLEWRRHWATLSGEPVVS